MGFFNATATNGRSLQPTDVPDQFKIRVFTGGFAGGGTADKRVTEELNTALAQKGYRAFKILNRRRSWVPSYYEYTVQFER